MSIKFFQTFTDYCHNLDQKKISFKIEIVFIDQD